jgi:hypothetical protein
MKKKSKTMEQLTKKELIEIIRNVRPKADAYDRVCEQLGIKDNILSFIKEELFTVDEVKTFVLFKYEGMMPKEKVLEDLTSKDTTDAIQFGIDKRGNLERLVYQRAIDDLDEDLKKFKTV